MTKKKTTLLNERVIRRWGKLANMPALTETFLDSFETEEEVEAIDEEEMGMEMEMGADEDEAGDASPEEAEAVEKIVAAVVDAISNETGVDIEVEGEADAEPEMKMGDEEGAAEDEEDPAMMDPAMMDPALRDHVEHEDDEDIEEGMRGAQRGKKSDKEKDAPAKRDEDEDEKMKKEELDLEVIDDEALTEAVLKRVVERLLKRQ